MFGLLGRFVLVVGDDGALLCDIQNQKVVAQVFCASTADAAEISNLLNSRPKQPVSVLVDVLDIGLRRELVPPVASWDLGGIVRRRLARAFPAYQYSGAIGLGRETAGRGDHVYLLAGIAPSTAFDGWKAFLDARTNPIHDIALLPIEASQLLMRFCDEFARVRQNSWRVMITRERTGGFRQVITRDGVIAFSRMTQGFEPAAPAEEMAAALEAEFGHTIEYLKRLGFRPGDGLDLVIVGDSALHDALAQRDFTATQFLMLSPEDVSRRLGFGELPGGAGGFSDLLHVLGFVRRRQPILSLRSPTMRDARNSRRLVTGAYGAAVLAVGFAAAYLLVLAAGIHGSQATLVDLERQRLDGRAALMALESDVATLPRPMTQMVAELSNWNALQSERIDPGPVLARLWPVLDDQVRMSDIEWRLVLAGAAARRTSLDDSAGAARRLRLHVTLVLSGVGADSVAAVAKGRQIADTLRAAYAEFDVSIPRLPVAIRPDETLRVESGVDTVGLPDRPVTMEVLIEGPRVEGAQ